MPISDDDLRTLNTEEARKTATTRAPTALPEEVGVLDRLSRGVDLVQATGGSAIQATGEIFGSEGLTNFGKEIVEEQRRQADLAAPPSENIGDILVESFPALGPIVTGAGGGGLVGGLPGALIGGGLTAFGMNLGTVKEIEETLDEDSQADIATLATAGLATVPDLLTGGALTSTAKSAIKNASKKALAANIAKDVGVATAAGVTSSVISDVGATISTTENFDEERIDTILENTSTAAILNAAFGAGASSATTIGGRAFRNQELFEQASHLIELDGEGNVTGVREPNPEAIENPSVFRKGGDILVGRSFEPILTQYGDNRGLRSILGEFDKVFDERAEAAGGPDNFSIGTLAQVNKADILKVADIFDLKKKSNKELEAIKQDIVEGTSTPEADKVRSMFAEVRKRAREQGVEFRSLGRKYYPWHPDVKRIRKNKEGFITGAVDDFKKNQPTGDVAQFETRLRRYTDQLLGDGGLRLGDEIRPSREILEDSTLALQGDTDALTRLQRPITTFRKGTKVNKNNNLETHRYLSSNTPEFLAQWARDSNLLEDLDIYVQGIAERLAFAEKFGADAEGLNQRVRLAQVEELQKKGRPLPPDVIEKVYDSANLTQRITSKVVSPRQRQFTRNAKALSNMLTLPSSVLSSLVEPLLILPKTGGKSALTGFGKAVETAAVKAARKVVPAIPKTKLDEFAEDMNTSLREATGAAASRIGEDIFDISKAEVGMFKYNGLAAWTEFTRLWTQFAVENELKKGGARLASGELSNRAARKQAQKIAEAGLDPIKVIDWVESGARRDHPYYKNIRGGMIDVAEDVAFRATPVRRPSWTNDPSPIFQFMSNLKTFPITFTNRIIMPVARKLVNNGLVGNLEQGFKTATFLSLLVSGYMAQDIVKAAIRGNLDDHLDKEPERRVFQALAQVGGAALPLDAVASESFGGSAVESVAGPIITKGVTIPAVALGALTGAIEPEEALQQTLNQLVPSIPGSAAIREEIKDI